MGLGGIDRSLEKKVRSSWRGWITKCARVYVMYVCVCEGRAVTRAMPAMYMYVRERERENSRRPGVEMLSGMQERTVLISGSASLRRAAQLWWCTLRCGECGGKSDVLGMAWWHAERVCVHPRATSMQPPRNLQFGVVLLYRATPCNAMLTDKKAAALSLDETLWSLFTHVVYK